MEIDLPKLNSVESSEYNFSMQDVEDFKINALLKDSLGVCDSDEVSTKLSPNNKCDVLKSTSGELAEKILNQLEYLFSDDNILKDKFLLKHVLQNKDGYVSLNCLLSMKKVRDLSKDWRVVADCLKNSKKLELSEDMRKVRRVQPISHNSSKSCSAVFEIPSTSDNFENSKKNAEVTRSSVVNSSCDFLKINMKQRLCNYMTIPSPIDGFAKLSFLEDACDKHVSTAGKGFEVASSTVQDWAWKSNMSPSPSIRRSSSKFDLRWNRSNSDDSRWTDNSYDISSSSTYDGYLSSGSGRSRRDRSTRSSNSNYSEDSSPTLPSRYKSDSAVNASWMRRRQLSDDCDKKKVIVIRQPRGPDGTIGFFAGRSRMNLKSPKMIDFEF